MKIAVSSICSANYARRVETLMNSVREFAPHWERHILFTEQASKKAEISTLTEETFLLPNEIGADKWQQMAFSYEITEYNTALKPFLMRHLFSLGFDAVVYFDPDIEIYSSLNELEQWLSEFNAVVTPHITSPLEENGLFPRNEDIIHGGQFNLGFLGLRKSEETNTFLNWWGSVLETKCLKEGSHNYFVDQSWADLIPSLFSKLKIIHHQGYNAAYWNLPQRPVKRTAEGWLAGKDSLVFFHYSGFKEGAIREISRHQKKVAAEKGTDLYQLLEQYQNKINGYSGIPYSFGTYSDGNEITLEDRRAYLHLPESAKSTFGNPFERKMEIRKIASSREKDPHPEVIRLQKQLDHMLHTPSWLIGRAITWLPRKLRRPFRNFPRPRIPESVSKSAKNQIHILRHETQMLSSCIKGFFYVLWHRFFLRKEIIGINLAEHMGDIVACEPVARHLRQENPNAYLVWLVKKEYRELVDSFPEINGPLVVSCLSTARFLTKWAPFSEPVDLTIPGRRCWECRHLLFSGIPANGVTTKNYFHHGNLLSAFAKFAGLPELNESPRIQIPESALNKLSQLDLPENFVAIHAQSNDECKDWPTEKWKELVDIIHAKWKLPVVELGLSPTQNSKVIDLCGKLTVLETAETIRRAQLFVGVDSGPAHLANAVGARGIILLGRYKHYENYMPFSGNYENAQSAEVLRADGPISDLPVENVVASIERTIHNVIARAKARSNLNETASLRSQRQALTDNV
jgi:heptosyltransferase III